MLRTQWEHNKTSLNNKFLVFFFAEIYQYYYQANEFQQAQLKKENQLNLSSCLNLDEINKTISHLTVDFINSRGTIARYSSNAPEFFGYSKQDFALIQNVAALIPSPICGSHPDLIQAFKTTKVSKYYCNTDQCIALNQEGDIRPINKCFSVNCVNMTDLLMECFISLNPHYDINQVAIQILDESCRLVCVSKNFWDLLEIKHGFVPEMRKALQQLPYQLIFAELEAFALTKLSAENGFCVQMQEISQVYPMNQCRTQYRAIECDMELKRKCLHQQAYYLVQLTQIRSVFSKFSRENAATLLDNA